jgi:hypothetical protein
MMIQSAKDQQDWTTYAVDAFTHFGEEKMATPAGFEPATTCLEDRRA